MTLTQPPAPGFVRLALLLNKPALPGDLATASTLDPEQLGPIHIAHGQALVDVAEELLVQARSGLESYGATQIHSRGRRERSWRWLRLAVGRNHGLTIGQLKRVMQRSGCSQLGRIHINNTHTLVGVDEQEWEAICDHFTAHPINGIAARPSAPQAGEVHDSPAFTPS